MGGRSYNETALLGLPLHWNDGGMTDGRLHNALAEALDLIVGSMGRTWKLPVATAGDLPPTLNGAGDARVVIDEDAIHVWSGAAWVKTQPGLHAPTHEGGSDPISPAGIGAEPAFAKNTAFNLDFGIGAGDVCEGDDARLFDARLPLAPTEASATATTTTTGATDGLLAGVTLTPGAGNYLVWFSTSVDHDSSNESIWVSLYVNGVQVPDTERFFKRGGAAADTGGPLSFNKYITGVGVGQAVEVRWRTTAATASAYQRTLNLLKVA